MSEEKPFPQKIYPKDPVTVSVGAGFVPGLADIDRMNERVVAAVQDDGGIFHTLDISAQVLSHARHGSLSRMSFQDFLLGGHLDGHVSKLLLINFFSAPGNGFRSGDEAEVEGEYQSMFGLLMKKIVKGGVVVIGESLTPNVVAFLKHIKKTIPGFSVRVYDGEYSDDEEEGKKVLTSVGYTQAFADDFFSSRQALAEISRMKGKSDEYLKRLHMRRDDPIFSVNTRRGARRHPSLGVPFLIVLTRT